MHLRGLNKCTVTLFITAHNDDQSKNEERKQQNICAWHAVSACVGHFVKRAVYMQSAFWLAGSCTPEADLWRERSVCWKKTTGGLWFPLYFCNGEEKKAMPRKNATDFFLFRKFVFCTWDIPIVPYIRYQNASFCAHEMSRYAAGTSA